MQHVCGIINLYQKATIAVLHHKLTSLDLQDQHHPSLKMFRSQGSYGFKGHHQFFLSWLSAAGCGAEPGQPGEQ